MPTNYRRGQYDFVIDSSFNPFTMQEMLTPLTLYKEEYDKAETAYNELTQQSDKFKYLSQTLPEGSQARRIYEGYANELNAQAQDLSQNGLSANNNRALTNLKRRYQGEIGRLVTADEAMQEEKRLRRQLNAKDASMLYALDNLNIDQFLDGSTPNLYSISGNELYARGATAGQAASKRVFGTEDAGRTLGGYYRDYIQRMGYTPEQLNQFGEQIMNDFTAQVSVLPELQSAANQILESYGVPENLKDNPSSLRRAQQQVIRGIIDGAVYNEDHKPVRDEGVMSAAAATQYSLQREARDFERQTNGWYKEDGQWKHDPARDLVAQRAATLAQAKSGGNSGGSGGQGGSSRYPTYWTPHYISGRGGTIVQTNDNQNDFNSLRSTSTKVNVKKTGTEWIVSVGSGNNTITLGTISGSNGIYNINPTSGIGTDKDKFKRIFRASYDSEYDDDNAAAVLNAIKETMEREGPNGWRNYNYYMSPDNVSNDFGSADGGGVLIDNLDRSMPTYYNMNNGYRGQDEYADVE